MFYKTRNYVFKKKVSDDFLVIVYQDNQTKEKKYEIIDKPEYTYYKVKPGAVSL